MQQRSARHKVAEALDHFLELPTRRAHAASANPQGLLCRAGNRSGHDQALDEMRRAIEFHLAGLREDGQPIPHPSTVATTVARDDLSRLRREYPAWRIELDTGRGVLTARKDYGHRRGRYIEAPTEVDLLRQIGATARGTDARRSTATVTGNRPGRPPDNKAPGRGALPSQ